jgi:hypothetical protein
MSLPVILAITPAKRCTIAPLRWSRKVAEIEI